MLATQKELREGLSVGDRLDTVQQLELERPLERALERRAGLSDGGTGHRSAGAATGAAGGGDA